jgi:hypothetical protein
VVLRQEPDDARLRIVVIPEIGLLDLHRLQIRFVEQMARELAARPGQVRTIDAIALQNMTDPELRRVDRQENQDATEREKNRHRQLCSLMSTASSRK